MARGVRSTAGRECWEPDRADKYARRRPEETLLHALVREHWPSFLERAEEAGGGREMRVAFSCQRRGFCPSCVGPRMSDVAAHLVDEVLSEEPIRQWVSDRPRTDGRFIDTL